MIEVNSKIINPEELMMRVKKSVLNKKEIKVEGYSFTDVNINSSSLSKDIDSLHINIEKMNETWEIRDFTIRSHRKFIGPFLILAKRAVRKILYWFIKPYWEQQTNFNAAATRAISDMARIQSQLINMLEIKSNGEE
ncbi:hypothetical protein [Clostridium beijerinckii]|uniref:hypothetical protein n=1 Tax=Clostridium beijerinckii TaxID=1520 RepID=UPI001361E4FE|nr:hypothetical protein [Clostridium beijerinckii]MZK53461.1 hypothetical protein [Clostridium beijerinckii]MZK61599.1 hypothetical protein [Clostridium beijerinckii]MZK71885.1 hypothetical protein [Clostridium beijerinckii]MZK77228.1 hypothetical protein [Clostridium beijerinckii]MZK86856.1 hypothetical protein [Clostridium beijerinckii]